MFDKYKLLTDTLTNLIEELNNIGFVVYGDVEIGEKNNKLVLSIEEKE